MLKSRRFAAGWFDPGGEVRVHSPPQPKQRNPSTQAESACTTCCDDPPVSSLWGARGSLSCLCLEEAAGYLCTSAASSTNWLCAGWKQCAMSFLIPPQTTAGTNIDSLTSKRRLTRVCSVPKEINYFRDVPVLNVRGLVSVIAKEFKSDSSWELPLM